MTGPLETEINQIIDNEINACPLEGGTTYGEKAQGGIVALSDHENELMTLARITGLKMAITRLARELDGE